MRRLIAVSCIALGIAAWAPIASADKSGGGIAQSCIRSGPANFYGKDDRHGVVATRDGRVYAVELRGACRNIKDSWGVAVSVTRPGAMDLCDSHDGELVYSDQNLSRSCRVDSIRRLEDAEAAKYRNGGPKKGEE
jgi:hypothetical protein